MTFSSYIQSCLDVKNLKYIAEMKSSINRIHERMKEEYLIFSAQASAAEKLVALYKLDNRTGSTLEMVESDSVCKAAGMHMAKAMLNAVNAENDLCNAFCSWVDWRYQCARHIDGTVDNKKAEQDIREGIILSNKIKEPCDMLAFWKGDAAPEVYVA